MHKLPVPFKIKLVANLLHPFVSLHFISLSSVVKYEYHPSQLILELSHTSHVEFDYID